MFKTLLSSKLLVDADAWQFWGKTKLTFYIFCPCSKNVLAPLLYAGFE